ncbi:MAG: ABC transporter ATP-binding protein [Thermoleophilia bacterium]|nr:ABC transporter ATP-binding protein [Thermoleophilia bacterium]
MDAPAAEAPPSDTAVRVDHIWKTYGNGASQVLALADVSLQIRPGEFVCLLGASGCGKSTLLNLIAGIYRIDRGSVDTGGCRVGMVFQEPALFPWLTVRRNVEASMRFRRLHRDGRRRRVDDLLHLVHLYDFGSRRPHELSGGMQQRAALARALAQDADVLLMDEPFGALDAMTRGILHDEVERIWRATGVTVLFVTHDVREAVRLGDRVVLLSSRPGRVIAEFPVSLARPRHIDSPEVNEIAAAVTERLREEVRSHG